MADNILKNEFMWEEKKAKKKLYKNWKLYAIALGITVIGAGTGLGVYYGVFANHSKVTKIALSTLNQDTIDGKENMTAEEAFNAFKENNKDKDLNFNNFDVTITKQPGYETDGSFTITAKTNTEYNGTITITINGLQSTALSTLNQNAIDSTSSNMTAEEAFNAFKENNKNKDLDLNNFNVTITKQPGYGNDNGSFTITAKTNTEYNGTITITINGFKSTLLSTLNQNAIDSTSSNMTAEEAFNAFKENNKNKDLDLNNFNVTITKQPGYGNDNGSFTITAKTNTKYSGTITITINGLKSTLLSTLNQNAIDSTSSNITKEEAFNAFKENNKDKDLDLNNFNVTITKQPGYGNDNGSFTITAKTNTKYSGTITITINAKKQNQLISVLTVKEIDEISSIDKAISAVLAANGNPEGLLASDLKSENFNAPKSDESGSVTITVANENSKYTGSVDIIIKNYEIEIANAAERIKKNPSSWQEWQSFFNGIMNKFIVTQVFIMTEEEEKNILANPNNGVNNKYAKEVIDKLFKNVQSFAKEYEKKYGLEELVQQYFTKVEIHYSDGQLIHINQKEKTFTVPPYSSIKIWLSGSTSTISDITIQSDTKAINYTIKDK